MNLRLKKTLTVLLSGAITLGGWTLVSLSRGGHLGVNPVFIGFVILFLATAGYTWWWYGESEKAMAWRAKVEAPTDSIRPVEIPLPRYLRPLLPRMRLRGWLMPLAFAVVAFVFWDNSSRRLDQSPGRHAVEALCFAAVAVFFVLARLWVGWRVRRLQAGK
ncbi:hypothetical protein [Streptomyces sp. WAC00263]|uniref:hypothetical protein n=1 Tax=Streptomyces sp. WAC00263 TaxID=1917422 RepID=UPI0015EE9B76|nr:hypothetical protein [Streptomyces sp. WAC00263]